MKLTKSGLELRIVIEKAIKDHVITNSEYEEIMRVANKDGMLRIIPGLLADHILYKKC